MLQCEPLESLGARVVDSPAEVAEASDVVFTIVGYPSDVENVVLGERGVLSGLRRDGILCDMTTSKPSLAHRIAEAASKIGAHAVDAPVSGGDVGAKEQRLSIMIGGAFIHLSAHGAP